MAPASEVLLLGMVWTIWGPGATGSEGGASMAGKGAGAGGSEGRLLHAVALSRRAVNVV